MEKRLLQTFFITLLFLIAYSLFIPQRQPQQPPSAPQAPTQPSQLTVKNDKEIITEDSEENLPTVSIGDLVITYSTKGGYVKKIHAKVYNEDFLYKNFGYISQEKDKEFTASFQDDRLVLLAADGERKEFIFQKNLLQIKLSVNPPATIVLFSNPISTNNLEQGYQEIFFAEGADITRKPPKSVKNQSETAYNNLKFAGARDRYFCAALLPGSYQIKIKKDDKDIYFMLVSPLPEISLYLGPQTEKELKAFGLQSIINYGFFHAIGAALAWLLSIFYAMSKSWGLSIIFFALFVYALLFPFTMKSTKAMKRMAEIQPEVDALRKKYKDNPQKLNKEILELYKKYKINPAGSCLPLLFQFPVFIALYQVLLRFVELKGVSFLWIKDLTLPDHAFKLPFPPPANYLNILPILIAAIGLLQQKLSTISTVSKEQKSMGLIFSLLMGVIFYNFPASLNLYWLVQNLLTFLYQLRISKTSHLSHTE